MTYEVKDLKDMIELLEKHPEWLRELRKLVLTDELIEVPKIIREIVIIQKETAMQVQNLTKRMDELTKRVDTLAVQVQNLTKRVDDLAIQVQNLTKRMDELTQRVDALTKRVDDLAIQVQNLTKRMDELTKRVDDLTVQVQNLTKRMDEFMVWQKGEAGRRNGEIYERRTIKDAPYLFAGGEGGSPEDPVVRIKLANWMKGIFKKGKELSPDERPTLADLIWWKNDKIAIVEVSIKINGEDVLRSFNRAKILKLEGNDVIPVVIGEDWASIEARELAKEKNVEWIIGGIPSEGLIAFRRLSC